MKSNKIPKKLIRFAFACNNCTPPSLELALKKNKKKTALVSGSNFRHVNPAAVPVSA